MHATYRTLAAHDLKRADDIESALQLVQAMHSLSARDLSAVIVAAFEDSAMPESRRSRITRSTFDSIVREGFALAAAELTDSDALSEVGSRLDCASRFSDGTLRKLADDMRDACDGFDKVDPKNVRDWADSLETLADELERTLDVFESDIRGSVIGSAADNAN